MKKHVVFEILQGLIDEPMPFVAASYDPKTGKNMGILIETEDLIEVLKRNQVLVTIRKTDEVGKGSLEFTLAPTERFLLLLQKKPENLLIAEGFTGREFYHLLADIIKTKPQENRVYVVSNDIGYAWFRTDLPEEEAMAHMLLHDDEVLDALGLPKYE